MKRPLAVINLVGLTPELLRHAPGLSSLAASRRVTPLVPVYPALTCSVQSSMLTGQPVRGHGVVGNGWFDRGLREVHFWKQSNHLVQHAKVWEIARRSSAEFTCANLFWWFNMATAADFSVTPRPIYKADGRKIPDIYTQPSSLRDRLQRELGTFPLFRFWGPVADISSSQWIADAAQIVANEHRPTLLLVYLPHLDYPLQRLGPDHTDIPGEVRAIDAVASDLINHLDSLGYDTAIVSEYGIEPATGVITPNRVLREQGYLQVRSEDGHDMLDVFASRAFAVADHQIAHVYISSPSDLDAVASILGDMPGVDQVLDHSAQRDLQIDHPRTGDLVLVPKPGYWFAYDFWLDDGRAPDYARTVDIHRKPGYDPRELFMDPELRFPRLHVARRLLARRLGFRNLLDVIPLDNQLVRGTHGRSHLPTGKGPLVIAPEETPVDDLIVHGGIPATAIYNLILRATSS
ncbi:MAG: alkaline phosphatase family protein [Phycisphaeraceae bacterium]